LARPAQFDLALAAHAEFIICNQSIDEVFLTINGKRHYLWRAVDQDDHVLDILVQSRRNKQAAKKFFRKLLKGLTYVPRVIITDKLKSYGAAKREILPGVEHRQSRYLNNRCEGIVKLLGLMPSPDSRGRILGSMLTDPALRPPALSL